MSPENLYRILHAGHTPPRLNSTQSCAKPSRRRPRSKCQGAVFEQEEHSVLVPRLAQGHELEDTTEPRVERVNDPDSSRVTVGIECG